MNIQETILFAAEMTGVVAFAISGAMVGIGRKMDLFGVCVLGAVTSVGGGIIRDIMLCTVPGALMNPFPILVALAASCAVFLVMYGKRHLLRGASYPVYEKLLQGMDAVGLGVFTAVGVMTGIQSGYPQNTFLLVFLGMVTGVGGGLLRDMMAGIPPAILVHHIYACASVTGALACVWLYRSFGYLPAVVLSSALIVLIRCLAIRFRWNLPRLNANAASGLNH